MGRGLIIALGASLALNVFAGGFIAGRLLGEPPRRAPIETAGPVDPFRLMRHAGSLPPEAREAFRGSLREARGPMREDFRKMRALREELRAVIRAEEWDEAEARRLFGVIAARQGDQLSRLEDALIEALGSLSAEDRRLLIESAESREAERRERRRGRFRERLEERRGGGGREEF